MPYKWSKDIWEEDAEWWNPYNKRGRLKGKGSTTWKRQAVRAAKAKAQAAPAVAAPPEQDGAQPLQKRQGEEKVKEEEPLQKRQGEEKVKEEEPLQKRQEATAVEQPLEKRPGEEAKPLEKRQEEQKEVDENTQPLEKRPEEQKEVKKEIKPLEKRQATAKATPQPLQKGPAEEVKPNFFRKLPQERWRDDEKCLLCNKVLTQAHICTPLHMKKMEQALNEWEAEVKAASAAAEAQAKAKAQAKRAEEAQTSEEGSGEWTTVAGKRKQWKKREEQPLQKGGAREVSLSSSSESNTSFPEPLQKRQENAPPQANKVVAVDWHNVLQVKRKGEEVVPDAHVRSIWDLQQKGFDIILLSFAGWARGKEVVAKAKQLPVKWTDVIICSDPTGEWGKAAWCEYLGATYLVDDNRAICQEALEKGLTVLPVMTNYEDHRWFSGPVFRSWPEAAAWLEQFGSSS